MLKAFLRYLRGYVKIRITGYSPERFLNMCSYHKIYIWGLTAVENAYEMYTSIDGFKKLRPIIHKTHTKVTLVNRYGFPFFLNKNKKRKLFAVGMVLCFLLLFQYSHTIWDIHIEGNTFYTDETFMKFLRTMDVNPGMPKSEVDCFEIAEKIRENYNDIVWVSASIDGSRILLQIKENEDRATYEIDSGEEGSQRDQEQEQNAQIENESEESSSRESETPTDLVASMDGTITSIITRKGVPLVHAGDTVKAGDILVTGRVEVLNDAKEVIGYQYQRADADIYADTVTSYQDEIANTYLEKKYKENENSDLFFVKLGSYKLKVGFCRKASKNVEEIEEIYQVKLGENFVLPVQYGRISTRSYLSEEKKYTKQQLQELLTHNFTLFSKELEEKGIQICENNVKIHLYENSAKAEGTLLLNQPITKQADTEILEVKKENPDESGRTDD